MARTTAAAASMRRIANIATSIPSAVPTDDRDRQRPGGKAEVTSQQRNSVGIGRSRFEFDPQLGTRT